MSCPPTMSSRQVNAGLTLENIEIGTFDHNNMFGLNRSSKISGLAGRTFLVLTEENKVLQLFTMQFCSEIISHNLFEMLSSAGCYDNFFPTKEHNLQCNDLTAPGLPQLIERAFSLTHHNSASHGYELLEIPYATLFAP